MKKLILLLSLAFTMCGCDGQYVNDLGIVIGVEKNHGLYKEQGKYIVEVSQYFNDHYFLYTNTLYTVGDTIQVTKKN